MSIEKTFKIGGELEIKRLGYGSMQLTGPGVWGPPADHDNAIAVLRRVKELGVDFIDTANSYGPYVTEELIREALHPYDGVSVGTKAGLVRPGRTDSVPPACGRPDYLWQELEMSLIRLGVDQLDLWQLHRIDSEVPAEAQFEVLKKAVDQGKARYVGLSEVTVDEIKAAQEIVPIATVQNFYNLVNRSSEAVLEFCEQEGIGFIPYFPLMMGKLAGKGSPLTDAAANHDASAGQIALAWLLHRSPVMMPIPGTSSIEHLEENVAAAEIELTVEEAHSIGQAAVAAA